MMMKMKTMNSMVAKLPLQCVNASVGHQIIDAQITMIALLIRSMLYQMILMIQHGSLIILQKNKGVLVDHARTTVPVH